MQVRTRVYLHFYISLHLNRFFALWFANNKITIAYG